jgi:hypothetical protein
MLFTIVIDQRHNNNEMCDVTCNLLHLAVVVVREVNERRHTKKEIFRGRLTV